MIMGGKTLARTIPEGVNVTLGGINGNTITYTAPFGEKDPMTPIFTVQRSGRASIKEEVKALGVTGKVYRQVPK